MGPHLEAVGGDRDNGDQGSANGAPQEAALRALHIAEHRLRAPSMPPASQLLHSHAMHAMMWALPMMHKICKMTSMHATTCRAASTSSVVSGAYRYASPATKKLTVSSVYAALVSPLCLGRSAVSSWNFCTTAAAHALSVHWVVQILLGEGVQHPRLELSVEEDMAYLQGRQRAISLQGQTIV